MSAYADTIRHLQAAIKTAYAASGGQHPVFYPAGGGVAVPTVGAWVNVYTTVARPVGTQVGARVHVTGGGLVQTRVVCQAPALTGAGTAAITAGVADPVLDVADLDPEVYVTFHVQAWLVSGSPNRVAVVDGWVR